MIIDPFSLRLIFMGTPVFAVEALKGLVEAGYNVVAVYSQPPKPVGRGYVLTKTPVHGYAESQGIPVFTPKSLRQIDAQEEFRALSPDLSIVAAYGLILPKEILETPAHGCLNIHGSILPRWRGAAPIQRAIMAGDGETGITIMKMDEGLDTGDMLSIKTIPITETTTASSLHDDLSHLGTQLLLETIPKYIHKDITPQKQPEEGITYATKVTKEDSLLDWSKSARELDWQIRGLTPWPGVFFMHGETPLKVAEACVVQEDVREEPGVVVDEHLTICCGNKTALRILKIQKPGGKWMSVEEFLRGYSLPKGTKLLKDIHAEV